MKLDIDGTKLEFEIRNYKPNCSTDDYGDNWCNVSLKVKNQYLDYYKSGEILECVDVDELLNLFEMLLNDELEEPTTIGSVEPDIEFKLYPKFDVRENKNVLYVKKGHEICDISVDMEIHFFLDGVLCGQFYTIALDRNDIKQFCKYLKQVTK